METKSAVRGICSGCMYAGTCTYHRPRRRVTQCDEFQAYPPPVVEAPLAPPAAARGNGRAHRPKRRFRRLGLCSTCDFGETCTLAPADGGVWHCAQYQ